MISYFLIIFFIVTIIIYWSFNAFIKSNIVSSKNRIRLKLILTLDVDWGITYKLSFELSIF